MRRIDHPGPVHPERRQALPVTLHAVVDTLRGGETLLNGLSRLVAEQGGDSAVGTLHGGAFAPFAYVMPALSRTPEHAVYFSDRHAASGPVHLEVATVTCGRRDGAPWLHCHAIWTDAQGLHHAGHVLPQEVVVAEPVHATLWRMDGAGFDVLPDDETRFRLFEPRSCTVPPPAGAGAFVLRLRPNEDVCGAIAAACIERGVTRARIRGGVGSLVGACFADGRTVEPFVTEVLVRNGEVQPAADGTLAVTLDVAVVDYLGGLAEGRLAPGANAVLVTFEMAVEPIAA
ncbi:hypothetical protein [uncultured Xylophilus sp.]|uniref:hypothetical protein n=1 Tax=uncultured Xylophilus sp. TaxID=296832 RepID=UPI0025FDD395|nr:hypothetical protein [uncultured Xylophilus sp.]